MPTFQANAQRSFALLRITETKRTFAVVILVAAVSLCYAPSIKNSFVWDDTALILRDPLIRSWRLIPESFNHFLFIDATPSDFYRPLQRLSYLADYAAFAFRPGGYHVVSILWQALAAVALLFFADELLGNFGIEPPRRRWIAFGTALTWAIHPVHSAAVVYVSGRADLLCATFGFFGCYFLLRQSRSAGAAQWFYVIAGLISLSLSLFSKEIGLIFPIILLGLFALRKSWKDVAKIAAAAAVACAIYLSLRAGAEHYPPPQLSSPAPALVRPIIVARAIAEYAGLLVLPINLHMDRDVETQPSGLSPASLSSASLRELQTLLGIVLIAAFFYWMWRARRNPPVFACLLFTLIAYLPISGIIALNATAAEHWIYLPSAFLFLAVAIQLAGSRFVDTNRRFTETPYNSANVSAKSPGDSKPWQRYAIITLFGAWLVFLGARTFVRTFDWKDQRTFVERTIAHGGDSARMWINLGVLEMDEGKLADAAIHFHSALQKKPDQPLAILNLGALALKQGDFKLARQLLTRASKMELVDAEANELLAVLENKENKKVDLVRLRLAARSGAPNWSIEKRYIQVLEENGNRSAAIAELINLLGTQWYRAESWKLLGELETKAGHPDQAANALVQARGYDVHLN
jgi:tetratricopeptide (TPR) repeat protein